MPNPITTDVIVGTYARGEARIVVTRHRGAATATLSLSAPSVTLDAAGHHALLQALAFPPAQALKPIPAPHALPPFSGAPKIGGQR